MRDEKGGRKVSGQRVDYFNNDDASDFLSEVRNEIIKGLESTYPKKVVASAKLVDVLIESKAPVTYETISKAVDELERVVAEEKMDDSMQGIEYYGKWISKLEELLESLKEEQ